MKELKKVNQLDPNFDLVNLNGEVCPILTGCPKLQCGCDSPQGGNTSLEDGEIIF